MSTKEDPSQSVHGGRTPDDEQESISGGPVGPSMDRRRFLHMVGLGAGTLALAGVGGATWRAVDGGVFATGTGPAYAAWDQLVDPDGSSMGLVKAAVLAANAHNTQPWHFTLTPGRIDLFADLTRGIGAMDPLSREMQISLGCALENLVLAGPPNGKAPSVSLLPDPADHSHIARVDLAPARGPVSPLFAAIATRHTNRGAYDIGRPVTQRQLDALSSLVDAPDTELVWFTSAADKRAFGDLTIRATQAIIADPQQAADDFAWYRTDWDDIQSKKDGITIDASGQSPMIRALAKVLPVSRQQNNDGWLSGTRQTQIPTAAAFGALLVRDPIDTVQRLRVGRIWQRMHLSAVAQGLAMQPLCQIPERIDRERSAGLRPDFTTAMAAILPGGWHPIMTFRTGYPTADGMRSPRRPATSVVLT